MVSPFVALYSLAKAVRSRDLAGIEERVDFRALRLSLSKQLVTDYLQAVGRGKELEGFNRQVASEVGATLADPLVAELVTPEAFVDLLDDGWPQAVAPGRPRTAAGLDINMDGIEKVLSLFVRSESRGFRNIAVPLPPDAAPEERFRINLRLSGLTWQVNGLDLPVRLRRQLIKKLPRGDSVSGQDSDTSKDLDGTEGATTR